MGLPKTNLASTSNNVVNSEVFDFHTDNINIPDDYDPTTDPLIWNILNDTPYNAPVGNLDSGGPSYFGGETSGHGGSHENIDVPRSSCFGNPVQVSVWPVPPSPYNCSCCQTLREIVHTNGRQFAKFEIHGRLGLFSHAVLCKYENVPATNHEYQMFDFCAESIISVKKFLVQYCQERKREGYHMLKDPLLLFYDALVVGLNFDNVHQPSSSINSDCQVILEHESQPVQQTNEVAQLPKSSLAIQRERTGKLELKDIARYFHLPIEEAAKEMNICPTVVKKICRRHGLARWPYRKVKSINKKISEKKQECLIASDARERARAQAEIQNLEEELRQICSTSPIN